MFTPTHKIELRLVLGLPECQGKRKDLEKGSVNQDRNVAAAFRIGKSDYEDEN
jgi:hypothetical protein